MEVALQNQIKSGEFTFCTRCGENCRIESKSFICTSCFSGLFSKEETRGEVRERILKQSIERSISIVVKNYRKDLAELRQEIDERKNYV